MPENGVQEQFHAEVEEIRTESSYARPADAFAHLCLKGLYDLDDDDAEEAVAIGESGGERGLDAFFMQETDIDSKLVLVQAKYSSRPSTFRRSVVHDLESALRVLSDLDTARGVSQQLGGCSRKYIRHRDQGGNVELSVIVFGRLGPAARTALDQFGRTLPPRHTIRRFEIDEIMDSYQRMAAIFSERGPDVDFMILESWSPDIPNPAAHILTVPSEEIARLTDQHRRDLFQINVREFLGEENPVNKEILKTLEQEDSEHFWHYNLGVSAICERVTIEGQSVRADGFRVVNGAQTCNILRKAHHDGTLSASVRVLVRLFVIGDDETMANRITKRHNRQTPIKGRAIWAFDERQTALKDALIARRPPWFYERRDAEWRNLTRREQRRFGKRVVDADRAAKAFLACYLRRPAEAKARGRLIWQDSEANGLYGTIFNVANPDTLLLSYIIAKDFSNRIRQFRREFKEMLRTRFEGMAPAEKKRYDQHSRFLFHSAMHLVALANIVMKRRYGESFRPNSLIKKYEEQPNVLRDLFEFLRDEVNSYLRPLLEDEESDFESRKFFIKDDSFVKLETQLDEDLRRFPPMLATILPEIR